MLPTFTYSVPFQQQIQYIQGKVLQNLQKQTMNTLEHFQYKNDKHNLEETNSESDRELNCSLIEGNDLAQIRENLHWKMMTNSQIVFNKKFVLYELIESKPHFDLYRAVYLENKDKVLVKIIDKQAVKQSLTLNQVLNQSQNQYQQFLKKLKNQTIAQKKLYNRISGIFLIRPIQVYENAECFIKITENYYEQSLESIIKRRQSLPVSQALAVIKQLIFALFELHKEGIILSQLNSNSIIYRNGVFKISDFSSMRKVSQKFSSTLNLYHSYTYEDVVAPQIIVCPQIIDIKSQIWALGVLLYQMLAYNVPFEQRATKIIKLARSHSIILDLKQEGQFEQITNLLRQMMQIDPDERISWKKLINSEILTKKEYFYNPKLLPMVDTRTVSLKKKQQSTIPQQVINTNFYQPLKKITNQQQQQQTSQINKTSQQQLNITRSFTILDEKKKINIQRVLDLQQQTFKQIKQINLMVLKAKWIKDDILTKLQQYEIIDISRRSHIEMMCLITERCNQYMRRARLLEPQVQDARLDNYLQQLKMLQNQVKQLKSHYKQLYQNINSSPYYVSNDLFSSFIKNKNKNKTKLIFLNQQQGLDFTVQQQIKYTQQQHINKFISQTKPKTKQQQNLLLKLKCYQKVNNIQQSQLKQYCDFTDVVNDVLRIKYY